MYRKTLFILLIFYAFTTAQNLSESSDFSYSIKLYNQEFYDLSAQQFIKFYTNYPNSHQADQAHYYAGMSLFNLEKYEKARIEFQSLAIGFPKSEKAAEAWLKAGFCSEKLSEPEDAIKAYETIRLLYPKNSFAAEGLYKAGMIALELNRPVDALQMFKVLMDQYSTTQYYHVASVKAAQAFYIQQETVKASQLIAKIILQQPEPNILAEALTIFAKIKKDQGQSEEAKDLFQKVLAVKSAPDFHKLANRELAQIYFSEKKYDLAFEIISKAGDDTPNQILAGDIHFLQEQYGQALKVYEKINIPTSDSRYLFVELKKALSLRFLTKNDASRASLKLALDKSESQDSPLFAAVDSIYLNWLEEDQFFEDAISHLNTLRTKRSATIRLAGILSKMERWRDVIAVLQPLSLVQENFAQKDKIVFLQAEAYRKTGAFSEALHYYRKLITDFAGSIYYADADKEATFLTTYKLVNKDKAVEKLADITAQMVNGANRNLLQFQLGLVYLDELKQFDKAETQFLKSLETNPTIAGDIHFYLGKTYSHQSQIAPKTKTKPLTDKAEAQARSAIQNSASCTVPDAASWLLVKNTIESDTVSIRRTKELLEALINKYPQSELIEEWYANLAARLAYDPENFNQSLKYFKVLVEQFSASPQYPEYLFAFAQFLTQNNDPNALSYYKKIAADFVHSPSAPEALYRVAADYEVKGQHADALTLYRKLMNEYYYTPQAMEARQKITVLLVRTAAYQEALDLLKTANMSPFISDALLANAFLDDSDFDQIYYLGRCQEGLNQKEIAIADYKRYLKYHPEGKHAAETHFNMGVIYFEQGTNQKAIDQFRSLEKQDSQFYLQGQTYLAQLYFDSGDYENAASVYHILDKTEVESSKAAAISAQYIVSLIRSGQISTSKSAIAVHKKKYKNQSNNSARFIVEIADYYRLNKNYNKAVKLLGEVKKKYKKSDYVDDADYTAALIHVTLNRIEEAFKILSNFYTNYPQSDRLSAALNTLGNLYFRTEKYDNAITMFKNALKARHDADLEANITSNLIKTYTLTGFWDAAQALARQYVNDFPDRPDILDKKIIIAQGYINLNQFQNAVDYLKKIKLESDAEREPEIQFYIGEAYLKGSQYENAIAEFVKIPLLSKKTKLQWEASALYYSGQSYEKLGRTRDAVRMYREIIDRPGIDLILKKEAQKRIKQIQ